MSLFLIVNFFVFVFSVAQVTKVEEQLGIVDLSKYIKASKKGIPQVVDELHNDWQTEELSDDDSDESANTSDREFVKEVDEKDVQRG